MKARFENNPVVEQLQARNWLDLVPRYRLVSDLRFVDSDGVIYIAPAGMETDGAFAVVLPFNAAVSSASYKIRCICSVGSGGGTVSLFAPEVIITR